MPKGLIHTQQSKDKISEAAKRTAKQSNAGFRQRVGCQYCAQIMSPANLGRHEERCASSRGMILNGKELSVKEIKTLRVRLKSSGWTLEQYIQCNTEQNGLCKICHQPPKGTRLSADHSHLSGHRRALLCEKCNFAIGLFDDNLTLLHNALKYIEAFKE